MTRQLVFVHGRAQEDMDADALKKEWVGALRDGLAKSGLDLPLPDGDIRFPYYGNALRDLVADVPAHLAAEVIIRGDTVGEEQRDLIRAVLREVLDKEGITDADIAAVAGSEVVERGPLNWPWVQAVLETIDRHVPLASGAGIALATNDVYHYLRNAPLRERIEVGVRAALAPGVPTVVVGHSLGSVVAYNILRRGGERAGWTVPLLVTLGSPLAVTAIKRSLRPIGHPACVTRWHNAMDDRDVVALFPLDATHFPIDPRVENRTDVDNPTSNRHGITGYLSDARVARTIHDAVTAP